MIESTYSCSSFVGFVSSNRRLNLPAYSCARPKFRQMLLACPMCRYPFGSGGNRVCTRPLFLPAARSVSMICWMKLRDDGLSPRDSSVCGGVVVVAISNPLPATSRLVERRLVLRRFDTLNVANFRDLL